MPSSKSNQPTKHWASNPQQLNTFIQELPSLLEEFWTKYKLPVFAIGLLLLFIVFCKILFAVLGAINDFLFLEPFFELVGIAYFSWFVVRYLLPKSGRQELGSTIKAWTEQVAGAQDRFLEPLTSKQDKG